MRDWVRVSVDGELMGKLLGEAEIIEESEDILWPLQRHSTRFSSTTYILLVFLGPHDDVS